MKKSPAKKPAVSKPRFVPVPYESPCKAFVALILKTLGFPLGNEFTFSEALGKAVEAVVHFKMEAACQEAPRISEEWRKPKLAEWTSRRDLAEIELEQATRVLAALTTIQPDSTPS